MSQFLLSQYIIKQNNDPNNNIRDKKGDNKSKKDDDAKSKEKYNNTPGTAGAEVGEAIVDKNTTVTPSNSSIVGAHVFDIIKTIVLLS